ncbi:hypothetical protein M422DRAFT_241193 [Sphaerobolus stellatus SS14]|nr:hypothetical protein M422DRAFT_241193 [Sphaerobolus stellatus SS14]
MAGPYRLIPFALLFFSLSAIAIPLPPSGGDLSPVTLDDQPTIFPRLFFSNAPLEDTGIERPIVAEVKPEAKSASADFEDSGPVFDDQATIHSRSYYPGEELLGIGKGILGDPQVESTPSPPANNGKSASGGKNGKAKGGKAKGKSS